MAKASTLRPLRRKTSHSVIERRRREKINEGLVSLQQLVPACRLKLKELLNTKVQSTRSGNKRTQEQVRIEADVLLEEKIGTQMVLEKLCIITHTVDYVRELQDKIEAYKRLCECSPSLPSHEVTSTHDAAHNEDINTHIIAPQQGQSDSGENNSQDEVLRCQECTVISQGKRHWGSNNPIQFSRHTRGKRKHSDVSSGDVAATKEASTSSRRGDDDSDNDQAYLELDDWHDKHRVCSSSLYTNRAQQETAIIGEHHRLSLHLNVGPSEVLYRDVSPGLHAPLGLLADVSEDMRRRSS